MSSAEVVQMPRRDGLVAKIAENVRVECGRVGWNQSDLARALGIAPQTVSKRWMGARQWQLEDLEQVAAALGIPEQRLLVARSEGLEPPTFWLVDDAAAPVIDLVTRKRVA